ncbi:glycosyltransferase [Synechococcus sp. 1G10]|uniref:glycosyltransferase n=1 Tax=Synechococcus sp. 1G10 TaxID=2025605 RepID=UPI000B97E473|nr:glycosyltransferase [Synechococcus sp. 1G10]
MTGILRSFGNELATRKSVISCADFSDIQLLDVLFETRPTWLNHIAVPPSETEQFWTSNALKRFPTAWANLLFLDLGVIPSNCWLEITDSIIMLMAADGLALICNSSKDIERLYSFTAILRNYTPACLSAFGLEFAEDISQNVAWCRRSGMNIREVYADRSEQQSEPEHHIALLQKHQLSTKRVVDFYQPETEAVSAELDSRNKRLQDAEDMLACSQEQLFQKQVLLDQLQESYQLLQVQFQDQAGDLLTVQSSLAMMELDRNSLRLESALITNSFKQSQDTLSQVINSRFWKLTALPRKLLDIIRPRMSQAYEVTIANNDATQDKVPISGNQIDRSTDFEDDLRETNDLLLTSYHHPISSESEWKGTFLNLDDTSTKLSVIKATRILFIDWKLPEPDKDSGSCRIYEILKIAACFGKGIDFISDSVASDSRYVDLLLSLGINIISGRQCGMHHLQKYGAQYLTVFISRPEVAICYAPLVRCYASSAQLIYDTVDLHFIRFLRGLEICGEDSQESEELNRLALSYRDCELFLARTSDKVAVVTEEEKSILSDDISEESVYVIPNIHSSVKSLHSTSFSSRNGILFVGGFDHAPNVDAIQYFCEQILPKIRKRLPEVVLHVVGSKMPDKIRQLRSKEVNPIGYLESLDEIFASVRLFVAPLRYGAGMKGKVGQSMSYGLPVIGTSIAFEGFDVQHRLHGMIGDTSDAFSDALIEAYSDPLLWGTISTEAAKLVESRFSPTSAYSTLRLLLLGEI